MTATWSGAASSLGFENSELLEILEGLDEGETSRCRRARTISRDGTPVDVQGETDLGGMSQEVASRRLGGPAHRDFSLRGSTAVGGGTTGPGGPRPR